MFGSQATTLDATDRVEVTGVLEGCWPTDDPVDWDAVNARDTEWILAMGPEMLDLPISASEAIPAGLEMMEPGPELAAFLSGIDVARLSGHDRIVVLRAQRRMESHYAAGAYQTVASVTDALVELDDDIELGTASAAAEVRAALTLTRRAADATVALANELTRRLPTVWQALQTGAIDVPRARVIADGTSHLSTGAARDVAERVIERASGWTTGQLRARVRRLCIDVDPADAAQRYEEAVADRRIVCETTDDGSANLLGLDLPPDRAAAAMDHVNRLARRLRGSRERRTMDQLRADVALDLLSGSGCGSAVRRGGVVDITVDLPTLIGLTETAGELAGYGPIVADIARRIAEGQRDGEWRWTVTDPSSDQPLATGITRRRPTAGQRRRVQARDRTCTFPGCRMPATASDLDHTVRYTDGGATTELNLAPLCRHDHTNRHLFRWTYRRLPDGDYLWTSRLGHRYRTSGRPP